MAGKGMEVPRIGSGVGKLGGRSKSTGVHLLTSVASRLFKVCSIHDRVLNNTEHGLHAG